MLRALLRHWKRAAPSRLVPARVHARGAKISVAQVEHSYANRVVALQDVDLNIRSGEFVCLLGPSGCGKSTLLYALAGHITPTGGTVSIDGRHIQGPGPDRLLMFQDPALFPWMTVHGNITFALGARGVPRQERLRRAEQFIRLVGLEGFGRTLPHQLSGGMKMRASLARALAMDSSVLLMDEPFGSLDAQTRGQMHQLLQSIWLRTHKTVVFVTHDVHEAMLLAGRVVVMAPRPGRILKDLELHLPLPRDPEDPELVKMTRHVRGLLRSVESESDDDVHVEPTGDENGASHTRPADGLGSPAAVLGAGV